MEQLQLENITSIKRVVWEDGTVLRYIVNNSVEVPNEEVFYNYQVVLKALETITPTDVSEDYQVLRKEGSNAYPSIGDQLDMIFRAGLGGDEFQTAIQAVKDAYPKV